MADSDQESSDQDLIREILELRQDETPIGPPTESGDVQDEDNDPFSVREESVAPAPVPVKKRNRRVQDSDDEQDEEDNMNRNGRRKLVLSEDEADENVVSMMIDQPSVNTGENDDMIDDKNVDENQNNDDALTIKPILNSKKRRLIIAKDNNRAENISNVVENDGSQSKDRRKYKSRLPVVSDDSDSRTDHSGRPGNASWQSSDAGSSPPEFVKKIQSVRTSPVPAARDSDADEDDIDHIIRKKHCSIAGRRLKYASQPNPILLEHLLNNVSQRSHQLRLGSDPLCSKENIPMNFANDKSDNDSIELEFSDEEESKVYGQVFQCGKSGKPSRTVHKPAIISDSAPSAKVPQKLQVRTQSVYGLYQNVGGQSSRQTMLEGLKKELRTRRMN